MDKLKVTLTRKLGPFPAWIWAVIALALIVGYMYVKKVGFFAPAPTPATDAGTGVPSGYGDPLPGGAPIGGAGSSATLGDNTLNPTPNPYTGASASNYFSPTVDMSGSAPVSSGSTLSGSTQPYAPFSNPAGVAVPAAPSGYAPQPVYGPTQSGGFLAPLQQAAGNFNPLQRRSSGTQAV